MANAEQPLPAAAPAGNEKKNRRTSRGGKLFRWVLGLALFVTVVALVLPLLVERTVNGILQSLTQEGRFAVEVKRLDLWGCDCSARALSGKKDALGEVENLSLRYSPLRLIFARRVDAVVIRGVRVPVTLMNDGVKLPVLDILKKAPAAEPGAESGKPFRLCDLPVAVDVLEVRGMVEWNGPDGASALLPLELDLANLRGHWEETECRIAVGAGKNRLLLRGRVDGELRRLKGSLELCCDTQDLPGALRHFIPSGVAATLAASAECEVDLVQRKLLSLETSGSAGVAVAAAGCRLTGEPRWKVTWDGARLAGEFGGLEASAAGMALRLENSRFAWESAAMRGDGKLDLALGKTPIPVQWKAQRTHGGKWHGEVRSDPVRPGATPVAVLTADYENSGKFTVRGKVGAFSHALPALTVGMEALELSGEGTLRDCAWQLRLTRPRVAGTGDWYTFTLPELVSSGNWRDGKLTGSVRAEKGVFALTAAKLTVREIALDQPLRLPLESSPAGSISAGAILWQDKVLGKAAAKTGLGDLALTVDGSVELCRLDGTFRAAAAFANGFTLDSSFQLPKQEIRDNLDLRKLFPDQLGDLELVGKAAAEGAFAMDSGGKRGHAALHLSEARAASAEKDWEVTGLAASFTLPRLPELRSDGRQYLRCKTIRYGTIRTDSLLALFRMDAPTSWCLEKLILKWCDGTVRAEYLQFDPASKFIPLTVHCDRLALVPFLIQLGAGAGTGAGRISGTLPVIYSKEHGFRAGDGFLYTTPGEDGKIAMEFSEAVKESQQDNMVFDMAQAALRDFSYSWAKIHMTTSDDLLKLTMQLNGKPEQPLYFTYADGGIAKTNVPHRFQGIMLDLNLSLPVKDIFELVKRF